MTAIGTAIQGLSLELSEEERRTLVNVLAVTLHDKRIEIHRTDALDYKHYLEHEEDVLQGLMAKLRR